MNYSKAIKLLRTNKGLTQKQLAQKIKMDASFLSLIEKGKRAASLGTLEKIAKALNAPLYLIILLASEKEDLKGISKKQSDILGKQLLKLLSIADNQL